MTFSLHLALNISANLKYNRCNSVVAERLFENLTVLVIGKKWWVSTGKMIVLSAAYPLRMWYVIKKVVSTSTYGGGSQTHTLEHIEIYHMKKTLWKYLFFCNKFIITITIEGFQQLNLVCYFLRLVQNEEGFLSSSFQAGPGVHSASYPICTRSLAMGKLCGMQVTFQLCIVLL
jgi:hypothetical protein